MDNDVKGSVIDGLCMDSFVKLSERIYNDKPVIMRECCPPTAGDTADVYLVVRRCGDNNYRCDIEDTARGVLLVSELCTKHDVIGYCLDRELYKLIKDNFVLEDVVRSVAASNDVLDNVVYEHVYSLLSVLRRRPEGF